MAILTSSPRGTQDILPSDTHKWQYVEQTLVKVSKLFGFREIRVPTFEHTELFLRSVGDTTDVVQKEMYTFEDKGQRSITLKPEVTASAVRAMIQHSLLNDALPARVFYIQPCFRYEKPQAGRLREFHQFGVELFGATSPSADAQVISLAQEALNVLGLTDVTLNLNSIGCPTCRKEYHTALRSYFEARKGELCATCLERLEKNPMRILDCKSPVCSEIAAGAPKMLDYLCEDCRNHFDGLQKILTAMGIEYQINPDIVRGLDYYTKTVFEFTSDKLGAQATVCGGGRYDGLVEQVGGPNLSGLGFGMGLERLMMIMEKSGCDFLPERRCDLYLGSIGEAAALKANELTYRLRQEGVAAQNDVMDRSVKAQMKYADKLGAAYSAIIGDDELASGKLEVKNMKTGEKTEFSLGESFAEDFSQHMIDAELMTAMEGENYNPELLFF